MAVTEMCVEALITPVKLKENEQHVQSLKVNQNIQSPVRFCIVNGRYCPTCALEPILLQLAEIPIPIRCIGLSGKNLIIHDFKQVEVF